MNAFRGTSFKEFKGGKQDIAEFQDFTPTNMEVLNDAIGGEKRESHGNRARGSALLTGKKFGQGDRVYFDRKKKRGETTGDFRAQELTGCLDNQTLPGEGQWTTRLHERRKKSQRGHD